MALRILSLNTWALSGPFSRDRRARMAAIGAAFARIGADAIALQEVWDEEARGTLLAAGRRAGLAHTWHHPSALRGSGLVVMSKVPIQEATLHRFELAGVAEAIDEADYLGGKGFVEVVLATPGGPVALVNTHLQAAYVDRTRDPHVALRVGQVVQLATHLRGISHPLVLAGDLNFTEDQEEYRVLRGLCDVVDVAAALGRRQATVLSTNPYRVGETDERIDYLLFRAGREQGLAPRALDRVLDGSLEIDGDLAAHSDHAGLLGDFALTPGGSELAPVAGEAVLVARSRLLAGRREVLERQRDQRVRAAAGVSTAAAAWLAARSPAVSRRRFLRAGVLATAGLAGVFGLGRLALTESLRPPEISGFTAALSRLDGLSARR